MDEPGVKARCFRPAQLAGKLQMTITYRGRVGCLGLVFPDCPTPLQVADDPSLTREEPAQPDVDHHLPGKSRLSRLGVSGLPNSPASWKWPSLTGEESVVKAWCLRAAQLSGKLHLFGQGLLKILLNGTI